MSKINEKLNEALLSKVQHMMVTIKVTNEKYNVCKAFEEFHKECFHLYAKFAASQMNSVMIKIDTYVNSENPILQL